MIPRVWIGTTVVVALAVSAAFVWRNVGSGNHAGVEPAIDAMEGTVPGRTPPSAGRIPAHGSSPEAPPLWRVVDEGAGVALPPWDERWSKQARTLVDVTEAAAAARSWRVGDRVRLEIPQVGERYEAPIEQIDHGPGYASAARGLATDADGRKRRFVVTVGPGRVFAYVDTPAGPYELVGNDRLAWLVPSSSMMAGFDFSKPDYILPEAPRRSPKADQAR